MKLYKIYRTDRVNYDEYDAIVIVANNEADALKIRPSLFTDIAIGEWPLGCLEVQYLGEAADDLEENTIILASYNAG